MLLAASLGPVEETYDFRREPTGDEYHRLIAVVSDLSGSLGVVLQHEPARLSTAANSLLARIEPWLLSDEQVDSWPGTRRLPGSTIQLLTYSCVDQSMAAIQSAADGLYQWQHPELPEDLHFSRADGTVLLGNVAHEADAWLSLEPDEIDSVRAALPEIDRLVEVRAQLTIGGA